MLFNFIMNCSYAAINKHRDRIEAHQRVLKLLDAAMNRDDVFTSYWKKRIKDVGEEVTAVLAESVKKKQLEDERRTKAEKLEKQRALAIQAQAKKRGKEEPDLLDEEKQRLANLEEYKAQVRALEQWKAEAERKKKEQEFWQPKSSSSSSSSSSVSSLTVVTATHVSAANSTDGNRQKSVPRVKKEALWGEAKRAEELRKREEELRKREEEEQRKRMMALPSPALTRTVSPTCATVALATVTTCTTPVSTSDSTVVLSTVPRTTSASVTVMSTSAASASVSSSVSAEATSSSSSTLSSSSTSTSTPVTVSAAKIDLAEMLSGSWGGKTVQNPSKTTMVWQECEFSFAIAGGLGSVTGSGVALCDKDRIAFSVIGRIQWPKVLFCCQRSCY